MSKMPSALKSNAYRNVAATSTPDTSVGLASDTTAGGAPSTVAAGTTRVAAGGMLTTVTPSGATATALPPTVASVAIARTVRVVMKLSAASSCRPTSWAGVSVQTPLAKVPADSVAAAGTPMTSTRSDSDPSVSVRAA